MSSPSFWPTTTSSSAPGWPALSSLEHDIEIVGTAADYDELIAGAEEMAPQVVVTDIRMPPTFQQEGIDAAHEICKRHPGTAVVVLSQFDDPEYAISLLAGRLRRLRLPA